MAGAGVYGGAQALAGGARPRCCAFLDRMAFGAYQAAQEAALTVPEQLSVVSFNDSDLAAWLRPALTSVALPAHRTGPPRGGTAAGQGPRAGVE